MPSQIPRNDLQAIADERLIEQYRDSVKLRAMIAIYLDQLSEVQDAAWQVLDQFNIDSAKSWMLDIIGRIVGLPRPIFDASLIGYFGYLGAAGAESYGSVSMPEAGGEYLSLFADIAGNYPMSDTNYRRHIKAKIIRNRSGAHPDDALEIVNTVLDNPGSTTTVNRTGDAIAELSIGRALSGAEKVLFTLTLNDHGDQLIPRPAGVELNFMDTAGPF